MASIVYWNTFSPFVAKAKDNTQRLNTIQMIIKILYPDICILVGIELPDLNELKQYNYYLHPLQIMGDEEIRQFQYCVLIRKNINLYTNIEPFEIGNTRYALEITIDKVKILATYLEYTDFNIRQSQLSDILSYNVDIICGINIVFCDIWREYFGNIFKILRNWKKIRLLICQPKVRQIHTPKKILYKNKDPGYQWEINSECKESYPLKFFMNSFLESNILLRITGRIWRAIFNKPILALDHVLVKKSSNLHVRSFILTGGDIKNVAGHGIVQIYI
jgi:hypothetical protein